MTKVCSTQREAQEIARSIARNQNSEVVIHRPNGQIRDHDSYGHDPYPPRGRIVMFLYLCPKGYNFLSVTLLLKVADLFHISNY